MVVPEGDFAPVSVMVDWEEEREKVLARGARCVSFNSVVCQPCVIEVERCRIGVRVCQGRSGGNVLLVSFHDMVKVRGWCIGVCECERRWVCGEATPPF